MNRITRFVAAYDTEMRHAGRPDPTVPTCLEACRRIVEVHRRHRVPATFFIVGRTLEESPGEYRALLHDPLFEIASHSYSHGMLRDHPICGPALPPEGIREQIVRGVAVVEQVFGRRCLGFRPGCGFPDGLSGAPEVLAVVREAGLRYVSSALWGPDFSLPAPLRPAYDYARDGYPDILELPAHGWHENLLKGNNRIFGASARRLLLFPPPFPDAAPPGEISTPEEEMRYNNRFLMDRALAESAPYVSLVWHPWSLGMFDPAMRMLELTFAYLREKGLEPCTFADLAG